MPRFRNWAKTALFLSSYSPLFFVLGLSFLSNDPFSHTIVLPWGGTIALPVLSLSFVLVAILSDRLLVAAIKETKQTKVVNKPVELVKKQNERMSTYLLVFVFVFTSIDLTETIGWVMLGVFMAILWVLQVRSELLHVNPMLGIRGYHIYEIHSEGEVLLVISEGEISKSISQPIHNSGDETTSRSVELVQLGETTYLTAPHD